MLVCDRNCGSALRATTFADIWNRADALQQDGRTLMAVSQNKNFPITRNTVDHHSIIWHSTAIVVVNWRNNDSQRLSGLRPAR
jgi:hypothetical protein